MKLDKNKLPVLSGKVLDVIFDCVYGMEEKIKPLRKETKEMLKDKMVKEFIEILVAMQKYNYHYRWDIYRNVNDVARKVFDFEYNSEGTLWWHALILALVELYRMDDDELLKTLKKVKIRK